MSVYLDYAATSPLDPRVLAAMLPYLEQQFGNPSSLHGAGRQARAAIDVAREQVLSLFKAAAAQVIFTASGTEANNLALKGLVREGDHLVVSAIEHPAILETCLALERHGARVTRVLPDSSGLVEPEALAAACTSATRLVSVMAANNVVGTLQPLAALAQVAHEYGSLFHTDAVQACGKIPIDMEAHEIDLLSLSAHKFYGPKGVGALLVRKGIDLAPLVHGGGQEGGYRAGTENVAGIVGLGQAAALAASEQSTDAARLVGLRDTLIDHVLRGIPGAYLLGHRFKRLPGHACFGFAGQEGGAMRVLLDLDRLGFAISSGSACSSRHMGEPSYVLMAMGYDAIRARGSLRISLGRFTKTEDIAALLDALPAVVGQLTPLLRRPTPSLQGVTS